MLFLPQSLIDLMIADARFHEFAVLATPPRAATKQIPIKNKKCGSCGRRRAALLQARNRGSVQYDQIRTELNRLPAEQQDKLKALLGVAELANAEQATAAVRTLQNARRLTQRKGKALYIRKRYVRRRR